MVSGTSNGTAGNLGKIRSGLIGGGQQVEKWCSMVSEY